MNESTSSVETEPRYTTLREIVLDDPRAAAVFERYGLDFCCRGNRPLSEACNDKHVDLGAVVHDLDETLASPTSGGGPRFNLWSLSMLADYVVENHHAYVRGTAPSLLTHTQKVAVVHAERHPEMIRVAELIQLLVGDLMDHMAREEQVLFPYIKQLETAAHSASGLPPTPFGSVRTPIRVLIGEHEAAGSQLEEIRLLTANYAVPVDACTTYRVALAELQAFESDLHRHVHLENNLLFPRAIEIEKFVNRLAD